MIWIEFHYRISLKAFSISNSNITICLFWTSLESKEGIRFKILSRGWSSRETNRFIQFSFVNRKEEGEKKGNEHLNLKIKTISNHLFLLVLVLVF